ncbi:SpoIIE family protein phosphatase [Streptomyces flaveolus]|uniref:SpoIIE family protein phosphatase n=1 Tax=Streptomyces flaveolus TaxID=67297 RepID=UPI0033B35A59
MATAGHPLPLVSPNPGKFTPLDGPPFCLGDGHHYEQREVRLPPGSVTAMFTDGLLDTRAPGPDVAVTRLATRLADGGRGNLDMLADDLISERRSQKTLDDDLARPAPDEVRRMPAWRAAGRGPVVAPAL